MSLLIAGAELVLRANRYDGSGTWRDESGNGHHAVLPTNMSYPPGIGATFPKWNGEAFYLDREHPGFTIPDDPGLGFSTGESFTIVAIAQWLPGGDGNSRLVNKGEETGAGKYIYVVYLNTSAVAGCGIHQNGTWRTTSSGGVTQGERVAVGFRRDVSVGIELLIDGSVVNTDLSAVDDMAGSVDDFSIGHHGTGPSEWFEGWFYGVALFRSALTDDEIAQVGVELILPPRIPDLPGVGRHELVGVAA